MVMMVMVVVVMMMIVIMDKRGTCRLIELDSIDQKSGVLMCIACFFDNLALKVVLFRYTKSQSLPHLLPAPSYSDILDISTKHFAQQITAMDNVRQLTNLIKL